MKDCYVYYLKEMWLHNKIPDTAIQLDGQTLFCMDRIPMYAIKTRGGGTCVYINRTWNSNASVHQSLHVNLAVMSNAYHRDKYLCSYISIHFSDKVLQKNKTSRWDGNKHFLHYVCLICQASAMEVY